MQKIIHYNPALNHQIDHAAAFIGSGFDISIDIQTPADVHVISGPHYAYSHWLGRENVLMIDRALWGDPDSVSIGWLQADGTRKFATGTADRPKPDYLPWKTREGSCLILADYQQDINSSVVRDRFNPVTTRRHPAEIESRHSLSTELAFADVVMGHSGTAIFTALMMGVPVICTDPNNICMPVCSDSVEADLYRGDRDPWLHDMSYTQFTLDEIHSGLAWELLSENID